MGIIPLYIILPSERQAIASREIGEEDLGSKAESELLMKGALKMIAFILTVLQFILIPVSRLVPLVISFVYYFTLPTEYKVTSLSR